MFIVLKCRRVGRSVGNSGRELGVICSVGRLLTAARRLLTGIGQFLAADPCCRLPTPAHMGTLYSTRARHGHKYDSHFSLNVKSSPGNGTGQSAHSPTTHSASVFTSSSECGFRPRSITHTAVVDGVRGSRRAAQNLEINVKGSTESLRSRAGTQYTSQPDARNRGN